MISSLASKCQDFKHRGLQFQFIKQLKTGISTLRTCHFEAHEDIVTKFTSQALHVIKIKYKKAGGSGNPDSFIPAQLWNIGILLHFSGYSRLKVMIVTGKNVFNS
jgi:hypothetical protein